MKTTTFIIQLINRGASFFRRLLTSTTTPIPAEHSSLDTELTTPPTTARPSHTTPETTFATKTDPNRTRTRPTGIQKKDTSPRPTPGPLSGGTYTTTRQ